MDAKMTLVVLNGKAIARIYKEKSDWFLARHSGRIDRFATQKNAKEEAEKSFGGNIRFMKY